MQELSDEQEAPARAAKRPRAGKAAAKRKGASAAAEEEDWGNFVFEGYGKDLYK